MTASRPPDRIRGEDDAEAAQRALERADVVSVWDLPQEYNVLQAIAGAVDVDVPADATRGDLEAALAEYFTDEEAGHE